MIYIIIGAFIVGLFIGALWYTLDRYKKMWRTLKAESGYRQTINSGWHKDLYLWQLMDNIEGRR